MACPAWSVRGVCSLVGGILIHLTLGNMYSFGNIMTYMVSYMHLKVDASVTYANIIWVNSVANMAQGFFMVAGGLLVKVIGPRLTCFLGCSCLSAGMILTYYTVEMSLFAVILTYGLLSGLGISLTYAIPLSCGMQWFPEHKGLVNGMIVGGFGLGALGFTTLQTMVLNPDNKPPQSNGYFVEDSILNRVPSVFLVLGAVFVVMQLVGCFLVGNPPQKIKRNHQEGESLLAGEEIVDMQELSTHDVTPINNTLMNEPFHDLSPKEVIKKRTFYVLWLIFFFNTISIAYINTMAKSFGQTFIKDDHFLAMTLSLAAVFNAVGRVVWGRFMDVTSFRIAMRVLTIILALLFATLPMTVFLGKGSFTVWLWAIFFSFSGTFVLMPTAVEKAFGADHHSANFGLLFSAQTVSGPMVAIGNQLMLTTVGFTGCFLTIAGILVMSTCMTFMIPEKL